MSYRSESSERINWRKWLFEHQGSLNKCGLPLVVLKDEEHWWDFLEHGYLDHHADPSGFTVNNLSLEEKRCLYTFLQTTLTEVEKLSAIVLRELEQQLKG